MDNLPKDKSSAKSPKEGDTVLYTAPDGRTHNATIDKLSGTVADLTVNVDGNAQKVAGASRSEHGGPNTWDIA
jgi:plastocyanin